MSLEQVTASEKIEADLDRLWMYLKHAGPGLAIVEVNSVPLRDKLISWLEDKCRQDNLEIYHLRLEPGQIPFAGQLREGIKQAQSRYQAIFLYNFESLLPVKDEDQQKDYISGINYSREILTQATVPIIFWLPEFAARLMQHYAPDLWDWHGVTFQFSEEDFSREIETGAARLETMGPETITVTDKVSRDNLIKVMERQYLEMSPADKSNPAVVSKLVTPLAKLYFESGFYLKALELLEQSLTIYKTAYGEQHPDVAATLNNIGLTWDRLGEYRKALDYYAQALDINRQAYGEQHPAVARNLNNIARAWYNLGEYQQAKEYLEAALAIQRDMLGPEHPDTKNTAEGLRQVQSKLQTPQ